MKTITVDPVTRIEGHARVILDVDDAGAVQFAGMVVNEMRGFERIMVGMEADRMPQITARICGVCPTAHHLASVKALDKLAGVEVPPAGRMLRELLYMGHFIHSHAVHLFALAGPDLLFGIDAEPEKRNVVAMVEAAPEVTKKALRLRSLGQKINESLGGRGVHPVTAVPGGMSFRLTEERRAELEKMADECLVLTAELAAVAKDLLSKQLEAKPDLLTKLAARTAYMGTVKDGKVNFYDGQLRVVDPDGAIQAEFDVDDYDKYLVERAVDWSYMKPVYLNIGGAEQVYRVNTLARMNVGDELETPMAQKELESFRQAYGRPCHLTVMHLYTRLVELLYSAEKAKQLVSDKEIMGESRVETKFRAGRGVGHVEAPRGTLIHDYEIDEKGIMRSANLIVATQQNYAAINQSIQQAAELFVVGKGDDDKLMNNVEFAIRCYDPCLSCATHALGQMPIKVVVRRQGREIRSFRRRI